MEPCVSKMCGGEQCAVKPTSPSPGMHGEEGVYITAFCCSRTSKAKKDGVVLDLPKPKSTTHKDLPQHPRISVHNGDCKNVKATQHAITNKALHYIASVHGI